MKPILCLNWKMAISLEEAKNVFACLASALRLRILSKKPLDLWVAPPLAFLSPLNDLYKNEFSDLAPFLKLIAQDISAHEHGAYTGETSARQVLDLGASGALIGHSERRLYHGETLSLLGQKAFQALKAGLTPILCLGEDIPGDTLTTVNHVVKELDVLLAFINPWIDSLTPQKDIALKSDHPLPPPFIVAYEPRWAIGTHKTPSLASLDLMMNALANTLAKTVPGPSIPLLYGGSVTAINGLDILSLENIAGLLIGGMSLHPSDMKAFMKEI